MKDFKPVSAGLRRAAPILRSFVPHLASAAARHTCSTLAIRTRHPFPAAGLLIPQPCWMATRTCFCRAFSSGAPLASRRGLALHRVLVTPGPLPLPGGRPSQPSRGFKCEGEGIAHLYKMLRCAQGCAAQMTART